MQTIDSELIRRLEAKIQYHRDRVAHYEKQRAVMLEIHAEVMQDDTTQSGVTSPSTGAVTVPTGEFVNDTMKNAIVKVLEKRAVDEVPAPTTKELYEALIKGGYPFRSPDDEKKRIALSTFLSRAKEAKMIRRDDNKRIYLTSNVLGGLPTDNK